MEYQARYAHAANDLPGSMTITAENDEAAAQRVRELVADGYRNGTWASVLLSDGTVYIARNARGEAVGRYIAD